MFWEVFQFFRTSKEHFHSIEYLDKMENSKLYHLNLCKHFKKHTNSMSAGYHIKFNITFNDITVFVVIKFNIIIVQTQWGHLIWKGDIKMIIIIIIIAKVNRFNSYISLYYFESVNKIAILIKLYSVWIHWIHSLHPFTKLIH